MADQHEFEAALERRLQARASMAARPFDASAIAGAAAAADAPRRLALPWTCRGIAWGWVAVMLATLGIIGGTLLAGALLRDWYQGPWLAYTSTDGVYLAHEDGSKPHHLFGTGRLSGPRWSADGSLLAVLDQGDGNENAHPGRLSVIDTEGRVVWSAEDVNGGLEWAHRGHRILWTQRFGDGDVMVTDVDAGSTSVAMPIADDAVVFGVAWSPDDSRIAVSWGGGNGPQDLRVVTLSGRLRDQSHVDASTLFWHPGWSPDGRYLAAVAIPYTPSDNICPNRADRCLSSLVVFDAETGATTDVLPRQEQMLGAMWSPDSTRLAWQANQSGQGSQGVFVGTLPLSAETVRQVAAWPETPMRRESSQPFEWTADGGGLLVGRARSTDDTSDEPPFELWRVPVDADAAEPTLLVEGVFFAALQPTP